MGRNKGVGNESSLTLPFLWSARLLSLTATCDVGLNWYRRVAVSFAGPIKKRGMPKILSLLPSIVKDENGVCLIRAFSASSRVDGNPSAVVVHDFMG